jgi:nucleoside 2-deoxyribosyltransferase
VKILLTGPSAVPYAREYISNAAKTLREKGNQVFVPHEGDWEVPSEPFQENRFQFDATREAVVDADMLIAVLDGFVVDDDVAIQIGMFFAFNQSEEKDRPMLGILHDTRIAGWSWSGEDRALNPQVRGCFQRYGQVYPNFDSVFEVLEQRK